MKKPGSLARNFGYININGEELPFKFGTNQADIYREIMGVTLPEYQQTFSELDKLLMGGKEIRAYIFSALLDGYRVINEECPYTFQGDAADIQDWFIQDKGLLVQLFQISVGPNVEGATKAPINQDLVDVNEAAKRVPKQFNLQA